MATAEPGANAESNSECWGSWWKCKSGHRQIQIRLGANGLPAVFEGMLGPGNGEASQQHQGTGPLRALADSAKTSVPAISSASSETV